MKLHDTSGLVASNSPGSSLKTHQKVNLALDYMKLGLDHPLLRDEKIINITKGLLPASILRNAGRRPIGNRRGGLTQK
jgi:hypothetical protein